MKHAITTMIALIATAALSITKAPESPLFDHPN